MKCRRNTNQRRLVLDAVRSRCDHPTAEDIYLAVHAQSARVSRGTVYRNLNLLADNGEITRVKMPDCDRYDLRTDAHYHLLCSRCNALADVPDCYDSAIDERLGSATGYRALTHRITFEGICPVCQGAEESAAS